MRFSAFAFQWIIVFVGLSLGGDWLDGFMNNHFPIFTLLGVFVALFIIFYSLYKFVISQNNQP